MIISDLDTLEFISEANQLEVVGSFAWANARARAFGKFRKTNTLKYTHSDAQGSISISGSSSSSSS